ncbi:MULTISPECIES: hypothetical protein [Paenibacillus]|uniref:hypothetical protein n=1 Tax=Paenibacillus TaxID=44249 RepID=UPI0022B88871|nr:hypothetical protein [Paenibacillus caseinilyticus]MCZ8522594.1 hypothetical protein [Paenibacillus caseinilyticus]
MTALKILLVTLLYAGLARWEWSSIRQNPVREKVLWGLLYIVVYACSLLVWIAPETPGPTQWVSSVLHPLGKLLEKG